FGLVGRGAALGQLLLQFGDQVVGKEFAQAVGVAAVPDGLDFHELLFGLGQELGAVEVARDIPVVGVAVGGLRNGSRSRRNGGRSRGSRLGRRRGGGLAPHGLLRLAGAVLAGRVGTVGALGGRART